MSQPGLVEVAHAMAGRPWTLLAMAWLPAQQVAARREALAALVHPFESAACLPFEHGVLLRATARQAPDAAVVQRIEALLGLDGADTLRYSDSHRRHSRALRLASDPAATRVEALLLAGDTRVGNWLATLLQDQMPAQDYGRLLRLCGGRAADGAEHLHI